MKKSFVTAALLMLLSVGLGAQTETQSQAQDVSQARMERPHRHKMKSPSELAKDMADQMKAEVNLNDKQYKKVYNLFKADFQYRQDAIQNSMPDGRPPMGGGPGMGGHGGPGMGGPGGDGMMGGGPGMGGGRPPRGDMQEGQRPEGAHGMHNPMADVVTDEYLEKQDAKLKKILSDTQYTQWRSKHPAEHQMLPPIELNKTEETQK